jgi:hypothetical protein
VRYLFQPFDQVMPPHCVIVSPFWVTPPLFPFFRLCSRDGGHSLALWCIGWSLCLPLKHCFQAHLIFLATQKPLQKRSSLLRNHVIFFHNCIIMHAKFTKQGIWRSFTVLKITNWLAYRLLFVYTWVDSHNFEWYLFHSLTLNQGFAASKLLQEVVV